MRNSIEGVGRNASFKIKQKCWLLDGYPKENSIKRVMKITKLYNIYTLGVGFVNKTNMNLADILETSWSIWPTSEYGH